MYFILNSKTWHFLKIFKWKTFSCCFCFRKQKHIIFSYGSFAVVLHQRACRTAILSSQPYSAWRRNMEFRQKQNRKGRSIGEMDVNGLTAYVYERSQSGKRAGKAAASLFSQ